VCPLSLSSFAHLTDHPLSPFGSNTPERSRSPVPRLRVSPFLLWAVQPYSAFKPLLIPLVLYVNWELLAPYLSPGTSNPFAQVFLLSGRVPTSPPNDPRYAKNWWDLVFVAYYIIFWSFVRQSLSAQVFQPLARYFGLRKPAKIDRFCEQGYALVYFGVFSLWGYVSLMNTFFFF
jgi:acyl-CoA-dependent ceramide synthase